MLLEGLRNAVQPPGSYGLTVRDVSGAVAVEELEGAAQPGRAARKLLLDLRLEGAHKPEVIRAI